MGNKKSNQEWEFTGITNSTQMNAVKTYGEEKFHGARGHGFSAERANDLYDDFTCKNATIVGDGNEKNGADRIVNGMKIQSKYCATGSRCIRECYNDNGEFRYYLTFWKAYFPPYLMITFSTSQQQA